MATRLLLALLYGAHAHEVVLLFWNVELLVATTRYLCLLFSPRSLDSLCFCSLIVPNWITDLRCRLRYALLLQVL